MVDIPCAACGTMLKRDSYRVQKSANLFCDRRCYANWQSVHQRDENNHNPKIRVSVVCVTCGREFTKIPSHAKKVKQHFCNAQCFGQWVSENRSGPNNPQFLDRIEVQCAACSRPLLKKPHEVREHPKHFCNLACQGAWMSEHKRGENNPNGKPRVHVPCTECGAVLSLTPGYATSYDKHFCNQQCRGAWMSKTLTGADHPRFTSVNVSCDTCGKTLLRQPNALRPHHFCNATCRAAWISKHRSGSRSHLWKGGPKGHRYYGPNWSAQRRAARQRDGNRCQYCGKTRFRIRRALDVHHIIPFRLFGYVPGKNDTYLQANDLMNLISLCITCHRRAEAGKIPLQPKLL